MAEMKSGDYSNALIHFNVYLAQTGMSEKNSIVAQKNVRNCEFALNAIKNPVPFNPVSIGSAINTTDDEYWPSITADGQTLMFTQTACITKRIICQGVSAGRFLYKLFYG